MAWRLTDSALMAAEWRTMRFNGARTDDDLARSVIKVVESGNCSGCGGCTLVSDRISMNLHDNRFQRPTVAPSPDGPETRGDGALFRQMCPGLRVQAPKSQRAHPVLGRWVAIFEAHAVDPETRRTGSSGGVLTALQHYLLDSGTSERVTASAAGSIVPSHTVPLTLTTKDSALRSAGSRYAPVSALANPDILRPGTAVVAKPCEASALSQYWAAKNHKEAPIVLSFSLRRHTEPTGDGFPAGHTRSTCRLGHRGSIPRKRVAR